MTAWPIAPTLGMTDREVRFVVARAHGLSVRQAATMAGYRSSRSDGLRQTGQEVDAKPHIRRAIEALRPFVRQHKELPDAQ
jgi:hypothetical protein